jgi:hypothetical protein
MDTAPTATVTTVERSPKNPTKRPFTIPTDKPTAIPTRIATAASPWLAVGHVATIAATRTKLEPADNP